MDKKKITGLLIMSIILITYNYLTFKEIKKKQTTSKQIEKTNPLSKIIPTEKNTKKTDKQFVKLENDVSSILINQYGSCLGEVTLKKFKKNKNQYVCLLNNETSVIQHELITKSGEIISLKDIFFEKQEDENENFTKNKIKLVAKKGDKIIVSTIVLNEDYSVIQTYELYEENKQKCCLDSLSLTWFGEVCYTENDLISEDKRTNIHFLNKDKTFYKLKEGSSTLQKKKVQENLIWIALKQRFFTFGIISGNNFELANSKIEISKNLEKNENSRYYKIRTQIKPISNEKNNIELKCFFGPNDLKLLKNVAPKFQKNLSLGWPIVRIINICLINPIYELLTHSIKNAGIVIFILIVLIKLLLLPLTYKAYISSASIRLLNPALNEIKKMYSNDNQRSQIEQMKLYKDVGINPLGGLIIALVQMPVLLSIFNFIPNQIGFRQQAFLWAKDISTYDSIFNLPFSIPFYGNHISLFALLMTISTIIQAISNVDLKAQKGPMKIMAYAMAITFMFIFNSFPASLTFYYFASNLMTSLIQLIMKKFVNEQEIMKRLEINKKNRAKLTNPGFKTRFNDLLKNGK